MIPTRRLLACAVAACVILSGCSGEADRHTEAPVLHWYAAPDRADLNELAQQCTKESNGQYQIEIVPLPADVDERRVALLQRLLAHDSEADLITVDTGLVAELGAAKALAPIPADLVPEFTRGVFPKSLAASTYGDELVTVPWWHDPYLLWIRGDLAERAGLNTKKPITWVDFTKAAADIRADVVMDDADGAGLSAWINSLIVAGDGDLLVGDGRSPKIGAAGPAGVRAARIVSRLAKAGFDGPSAGALETFAAKDGAFLLAPSSAIVDTRMAPVVKDLAWAGFPVVDRKSGGTPLVGQTLGVPLFAPSPDLSYDAIGCLTSAVMQKTLMVSSGHNPARQTVYSDPSIRESFPLGTVVRPAVAHGAIEPLTPYWHLVRRALAQTWTPLAGVDDTTAGESADRIAELVRGGLG